MSNVSFDATYPWYEGGRDCTRDEYPSTVVEVPDFFRHTLMREAGEIFCGDEGAYALTVTVDGRSLTLYTDEDWLADSQEDADYVVKNLSGVVLAAAVREYGLDMGFLEDEDDEEE